MHKVNIFSFNLNSCFFIVQGKMLPQLQADNTTAILTQDCRGQWEGGLDVEDEVGVAVGLTLPGVGCCRDFLLQQHIHVLCAFMTIYGRCCSVVNRSSAPAAQVSYPSSVCDYLPL